MAPFDRSHTSSYSHSIVTMARSCIIYEIKRDFDLVPLVPLGTSGSSLAPFWTVSATYSTSSYLKSTICKYCWKVLRHVFWGRPVLLLESRMLPLSPLDDLVSVVLWPVIRNLRSVTMYDSFLELAQSKISSFVMWSLYVTVRIFLKHCWWKMFNLRSVLAVVFHVSLA